MWEESIPSRTLPDAYRIDDEEGHIDIYEIVVAHDLTDEKCLKYFSMALAMDAEYWTMTVHICHWMGNIIASDNPFMWGMTGTSVADRPGRTRRKYINTYSTMSGPVRPTVTYISHSSLNFTAPITKGIYLSCTFHSPVDLNLGWRATVSSCFTGFTSTEGTEKTL